MSNKTVRQLAEVVKIPLERLLEQLKEAGLSASAPDDVINEDEKMQLLAHLRKRHGKDEGAAEGSLKRVTLKRRTVSELKQASVPGSTTKTISVEIRKQKTYIKRSEVTESDEQRNLELAKQAVKGQVAPQTESFPTAEEPVKAQETVLEQKKEAAVAPEATPAVEEQVTAEPEVEHIASQPIETLSPSLAVEEEAEVSPVLDLEAETDYESLVKAKESTEARKKQHEKDLRLEESIKRNAEKVRQQASAKQEILHRKKQEESSRAGAGGRDTKKAKKKGKKTERVNVKPEGKHQFEMPVEPIIKEVTIPEMIIVSDLAQKMSVKAATVIKHLMKLGIMATINQSIDQETAVILVEEMGHKAIMQSDDDLEQEMLAEAQADDDNRVELPRAPIVTIMGHVDHGKTSLLDYIRKTRVAAGEAGGITQHIGAYQVKTDHGSVTFLDTPGHAAFTAMRARGADVTDVVIVVVAADDGVMPQTKEAVEHARAANVPIIVAINKIDKPDANPDKVMQELSNINVLAEEWGGDVQFLRISAKTGEGIDDLIEALIVQTEILELKAPVEGAASGIVIESRLDKGRGVVATVLIQKGTLESGQMVLCGHEYGRVRAMFNENGVSIKEAGPCAPVEILGLSGTPNAGDEFLVVQNERIAKDLAKHREDRKKLSRHAVQQASKLDEVFSRMTTGEIASVNLVLKTDVQGSLEALRSSLVGLSNDEVEVKVVFGGVGGINEGDANLALASGAILMGFNVRADATARKLIEEKGIDLHYYSIIYEAIDEVKKAISGMLAPEIKEQIVGLAEVRDVFKSPKFGAVAGCMVVDGYVKRNLPIRVLRNNVVIFEGQLESLRRFKDDANEVKMGMECGIGVKNYNDVQPGDQIEVFERIEVKREL
ncbi:translation initiation factor IF-2 [Methylobacter sp. Wu8]|uniref:Translation initiation factor IF-2 n=1 Tax=Methylobacter tundripaludum TaxID=173365 RepID=A0A2S6GSI9_9GAMM|nr:translation initiation factor IF-2 [Methylobacter tundripaludum]MCK9635362.1 translation initiation factor IF-2 [Methylobacter tundripaludum]PPK68194.1 translation initiation factor 2 (bIF-2) [Methylobacter tundripaludum]